MATKKPEFYILAFEKYGNIRSCPCPLEKQYVWDMALLDFFCLAIQSLNSLPET
jgi:hypothetical protein